MQVSAAEDFFNSNPKFQEIFEEYKQNPKPQRQIFEKTQFPEFFFSRAGFNSSIIRKSCQLLEEEFNELLPKVESTSISLQGFKNLDQNTVKIVLPILGYIEKNYLVSEFRQKKGIFISLDEFQTQVWAILYLLFRTGKVKTLMKLMNCYTGSVNLKEFVDLFPKYIEKENLGKDDRNVGLGMILNNNQNIDVFQYSLFAFMTKYNEIISVDLVGQLADYLWYNVILFQFM